MTRTNTTTTRSQARTVYLAVVNNWAVYASDISEEVGLDAKATTQVLRQLEAKGLVHAHHVNGERKITWQTDFDVENEAMVPARAGRAFKQAWPEDEQPQANGNTGSDTPRPRYTDEQLRLAREAKAAGGTRKQVAEAAGIRSPNYLAKLLKRMAEAEAKAAKAAKRRTRKASK